MPLRNIKDIVSELKALEKAGRIDRPFLCKQLKHRDKSAIYRIFSSGAKQHSAVVLEICEIANVSLFEPPVLADCGTIDIVTPDVAGDKVAFYLDQAVGFVEKARFAAVKS